MKKKKQHSSSAAGDTAASVSASVDVKSLIHDHALFFDRLVELIPAKFYLPTDSQEKVWFQGLSKSAKAKAKKKTIENTKKARRDRLDPEKSSKTTLDLLKESVEKEKSGTDGVEGASGSVTYEELRQKLRRKIEDLRAGRGGTDEDRERREEIRFKKRNREGFNKKKEESNESEEKEKRDVEKEVSAAAEEIRFGKMKLGEDDWGKNKKRRLSKEKELERAQKLKEAMSDPEKGKVVAEKHSWQAAASRAMGEKVHDNPRLLKESLQKDKRKHKKSVEKWKDRVKNVDSKMHEKQEKRKGNIQAVIEKKKQKKIERREKKLMKKRPGFEGRKEGYINAGD